MLAAAVSQEETVCLQLVAQPPSLAASPTSAAVAVVVVATAPVVLAPSRAAKHTVSIIIKRRVARKEM